MSVRPLCQISVPAHEAFTLEIHVPVSMEANYSTYTDSRTHRRQSANVPRAYVNPQCNTPQPLNHTR